MRELYIEVRNNNGRTGTWNTLGLASNPTQYSDRTLAQLMLEQLKLSLGEQRNMRVRDGKTGRVIARAR